MLVSNGDTSLYVKAGYAQADLEITNISRQATATAVSTGAASDAASTDGPMTKSLEGPMYGIGVQVAMDNFVDSIRVEQQDMTLMKFHTSTQTARHLKLTQLWTRYPLV